MMNESAGRLVRGSSEGGAQFSSSLFHFLIFLIFSRENGCENAFRTPQPNWSTIQTRLWADSGSALEGHPSADVRVVRM